MPKKIKYPAPRNPAGINQHIKGSAHKEKGAAIAVRLPLELDEKLRKLAQQSGNSLSQLLQMAIEQLLEKSELMGAADTTSNDIATKPATAETGEPQ